MIVAVDSDQLIETTTAGTSTSTRENKVIAVESVEADNN